MECKTYHTKTGKEIRLWQGDCMELMESGNKWHLAIIDPPYRKESENQPTKDMRNNGHMNIGDKPDFNYFNKLKEVTDNSIIWGANNYNYSFKGFVVWKKKTISELFTMSMAEIASLSEGLATTSKFIEMAPQDPQRIHPNQKPVNLYRWLLYHYAEEGDTILDTYGGSMSLAIACYIEDYELDIIELDEDYYRAAVKRFEEHVSQKTLF